MENPSTPAIPWYRTRTFWAIVYSLMLLWSVFFYFSDMHHATTSFKEFLSFATLASGGTLFGIAGTSTFGSTGGYVAAILYAALVGFLIRKTFQGNYVRLIYPSILIAFYLIGMSLALTLLSSFS